MAVPALAAALPDPITAPILNDTATVGLRTVADGLGAPTAGLSAPGIGHSLFVTEQQGKIWQVDTRPTAPARTAKRLVGDLAAPRDATGSASRLRVNPRGYDERGLLGLAFSPHFAVDRLLYTFTTEAPETADFSTPVPDGVDPAACAFGATSRCQVVIREWQAQVSGPPSSRTMRLGDENGPGPSRVLMRIDKPQFNHNGGGLAFGPDEMLYIGVGDGGGANDTGNGHALEGNGQALNDRNALGKILRIDVRLRNSGNGQYGIPTDNPFVGPERPGGDEVYAYGFRNPYRLSFSADGQLWVADVGQRAIEEVDVVVKGGNYGWPRKEGTFLLDLPRSSAQGVSEDSRGVPSNMVDPVAQYDHTASPFIGACGFLGPVSNCNGIAVVGGYAYRGAALPPLAGRYVFGDYGRAALSDSGRLFVLGEASAETGLREVRALGTAGGRLGLAVTGMAEDSEGELYVLGNTTGSADGMNATTTSPSGVVRKLVPVESP